MPIPRENALEWHYWIFLEMFVAGIAAGAYLTAAILEFLGHGRSRAARTAHLIAFPLMALGAGMLVIDLNRPERFTNMIFANHAFPAVILKPWSPISFGTWLVSGFLGVTFVSFVDALFDLRRWRVARWGVAFVHGGPIGIVLAILGGLLAIGVGSYSGLLLQATNYPGWRDTALLGGEYMATAAVTGVAAVIFLRPILVPRLRVEDVVDVVELSTYMALLAVLWVVGSIAFLLASASGLRFIFHGLWLGLFVLGAALLVLPALMLFRPRSLPLAQIASGLVLIGGLLVRIALVMGPQEL